MHPVVPFGVVGGPSGSVRLSLYDAVVMKFKVNVMSLCYASFVAISCPELE